MLRGAVLRGDNLSGAASHARGACAGVIVRLTPSPSATEASQMATCLSSRSGPRARALGTLSGLDSPIKSPNEYRCCRDDSERWDYPIGAVHRATTDVEISRAATRPRIGIHRGTGRDLYSRCPGSGA